jgi:WD40 repeat protein
MIQSVAWAPGGAGRLVIASGDGTARLLDAGDGHVLRTFAVDGQASLVAADASGRWAAIATETGTIALVDLAGDAAPRVVTPSLQPTAGLAFAGDRLVSAGTDGTLRVHDPATGNETARVPVGRPLIGLAVAPDARHAATADADQTVRVHRLTDGAVVDRLTWHRSTIGVLAWGAGATLVAGDNDGALAVWDVPAAGPGVARE